MPRYPFLSHIISFSLSAPPLPVSLSLVRAASQARREQWQPQPFYTFLPHLISCIRTHIRARLGQLEGSDRRTFARRATSRPALVTMLYFNKDSNYNASGKESRQANLRFAVQISSSEEPHAATSSFGARCLASQRVLLASVKRQECEYIITKSWPPLHKSLQTAQCPQKRASWQSPPRR